MELTLGKCFIVDYRNTNVRTFDDSDSLIYIILNGLTGRVM